MNVYNYIFVITTHMIVVEYIYIYIYVIKLSSCIYFIDKDPCSNINEHNNNIIILMTMPIRTNPVRRRTNSVSISPRGCTFIGNKRHEIDRR